MTTCSLPPCAATGSRWSPSSLSPSCHGGEFICLVSGAWRLCHPGLFHRTCMLPASESMHYANLPTRGRPLPPVAGCLWRCSLWLVWWTRA